MLSTPDRSKIINVDHFRCCSYLSSLEYVIFSQNEKSDKISPLSISSSKTSKQTSSDQLSFDLLDDEQIWYFLWLNIVTTVLTQFFYSEDVYGFLTSSSGASNNAANIPDLLNESKADVNSHGVLNQKYTSLVVSTLSQHVDR